MDGQCRRVRVTLESVAEEAGEVSSIDDYKEWVRRRVRALIPHDALLSGVGHIHSAGVGQDYLVLVDFPVEYVKAIRNRAGGTDSPIMRRWYQERRPLLFEDIDPWPGTPDFWLEQFRVNRFRNVLAHGRFDNERCMATYHCLYRMPGRPGQGELALATQLVPVMHDVLCRVVEGLAGAGSSLSARLSVREAEVVRWLRAGKTNGDIARILGLSENTVKHHITSIFRKIGVDTRAGLLCLLGERDARAAANAGMQIL